MDNYIQYYIEQFNKMRSENLGKSFERRELGIMASQHGIYINSTLWNCGLNNQFHVAKVGPKYVYTFRKNPMVIADFEAITVNARIYRNNRIRKIEHAKEILRRYGIREVD